MIDLSNSIHIKRQFENVSREDLRVLTKSQLDKIHEYVLNKCESGQWTDLANNVQKLGNEEEKEGLGKFVYELFDKNVTYGQLASHIAALFVDSDAWFSNGAQRGIKVCTKTVKEGWPEYLKTLYEKSSKCD